MERIWKERFIRFWRGLMDRCPDCGTQLDDFSDKNFYCKKCNKRVI